MFGINVVDMGADRSGLRDSADAFDTWMDQVIEYGSGIIPPGDYLCSRPISKYLKDGPRRFSIFGAGMSQTRIHGPFLSITNKADSPPFFRCEGLRIKPTTQGGYNGILFAPVGRGSTHERSFVGRDLMIGPDKDEEFYFDKALALPGSRRPYIQHARLLGLHGSACDVPLEIHSTISGTVVTMPGHPLHVGDQIRYIPGAVDAGLPRDNLYVRSVDGDTLTLAQRMTSVQLIEAVQNGDGYFIWDRRADNAAHYAMQAGLDISNSYNFDVDDVFVIGATTAFDCTGSAQEGGWLTRCYGMQVRTGVKWVRDVEQPYLNIVQCGFDYRDVGIHIVNAYGIRIRDVDFRQGWGGAEAPCDFLIDGMTKEQGVISGCGHVSASCDRTVAYKLGGANPVIGLDIVSPRISGLYAFVKVEANINNANNTIR